MSDENPFTTAEYNPPVRPDAEERADTPRDQYGRYLMPRPGMEHMAVPAVASTRVSTVKSAGINRKGLEIWGKRTATKGFLRDLKVAELQTISGAELLIAALKATQDGDNRELDRIVTEAYNRGGGKERSTLGTAVHEFTERRNRGEDVKLEDAPEQHRRDIRAYEAALERAGVHIIPEYLERIVNCPWSIQGTADNIVWYQNPNVLPDDAEPGTPGEMEMRVADLKTGRDLVKGWGEILIQLWLYANATHMWDASVKRWVPMPRELRKDRGIIFHVPMDGTATVYDVNLAGIGDVVAAAMTLRRHHDEAPLAVTKVVTVDMRDPAYVAPARATQDEFTLAPPPESPEQLSALQDQVDSADAQLAGQEPPAVPGLEAADGTPLQPIGKRLDPPRRGCGVCGRIGHKRGSAACWGDQDPAIRNQIGKALDAMAANADPMTPAEDEFSDVPGQMPDATNAPGQMPDATDAPYCAGCNEGWRPGPDGPGGVWVCGKCGLPSAPVATTVAEAQVQPHQVPSQAQHGAQNDPSHVFTQPAAEPVLSVPAATVTTAGAPWPTDWVLPAIAKATGAQEVLNIRTEALNRGAWNPEMHDGPGQARYQELLSKGLI